MLSKPSVCIALFHTLNRLSLYADSISQVSAHFYRLFHVALLRYYRGAHGIIIVYDVNDVRTFCNVERWTDEANMYADESIARILGMSSNDRQKSNTFDGMCILPLHLVF